MTREEAINLVMKVFDTLEDECNIEYDWREEHEARDMAIKALEQETVSREVYDHEYTLRKELSLKVYKLDRLLEQADLALSKIKIKLRSPRGVCDYLIVDEIEKIINEYDEIVMKIFDFIERKRKGEVEEWS